MSAIAWFGIGRRFKWETAAKKVFPLINTDKSTIYKWLFISVYQ